ncbi:MAG: hypothetical protein ACOX3R_14060 [Desulfitobacteriia bacterium]
MPAKAKPRWKFSLDGSEASADRTDAEKGAAAGAMMEPLVILKMPK